MEARDVIDGDEVSLASNGVVKSNGGLMGYNSSPSAWLIEDHVAENCSSLAVFGQRDKKTIKQGKFGSGGTILSEAEMMKERFAKLMLGEDMSGSGNGVCSALALSNSITNLCATIFGKLWRLEPLPAEKKNLWRREMDWLLSVSDHIVEMVPSCQTLSSGSILEVMNIRPRADLLINLPALRKLDNMLLEILDGFCGTEFWYVDQRIVRQDSNVSICLSQLIGRQDEKWWLPMPQVPADGVTEITRKNLIHKRECANQILKAAMSINNAALAEMDIPDSYWGTLPKTGKETLGDFIHKCISSEQFSADHLLDCLQLPSEHRALEIANRIETTLYIWRQRSRSKVTSNSQKIAAKPRWNSIVELLKDGDKTHLLAERAESVLICLKQRFPCLPQTTLDMSKIQCNQDVGKSILESYSRVLESIASNIVARIDDLLWVDSLLTQQDNISTITTANIVSHNRSVPISSSLSRSSTSYQTAYTSLSFSSPVSPSKSQLPNTIFPVYELHEKQFGHDLMEVSPERADTTASMNNWEELITIPARTLFSGRKGSRSDITMG